MKKKYLLITAKKIITIHLLNTFVFLILFFAFRDSKLLFEVLLFLYVVANIIILIVGYYSVVRKINLLNKVYKAFGSGDVAYNISYKPYALSVEHESMMETMNSLLNQKDMVELYRSQAEYLALQNQIKPHFLYNTLEGIRSEALIGGLPLVGEMTEVLAKYFRYTISNVKSMVTLRDEILNVENYCRIQHFRLGEKLSYQIIFEDDSEKQIKKLYMPKLILQPIVENAIQHGIEPLMREGTIILRFCMLDSRLLIIVSDNGVGMEAERVRILNERMKNMELNEDVVNNQEGGIALANVNNRIKLLFGNHYGLTFYSRLNLGTDVEITLPLQDMEREEMHEKRITAPRGGHA